MIVGIVYGTLSTWFIAGPFMLMSDKWFNRDKRAADKKRPQPATRMPKTTTT